MRLRHITSTARKFSISKRPIPTTIVFDKDGTLIDAHATWAPVFQRVCELTCPDDTSEIYKLLGYDPAKLRFHASSSFMIDTNETVHELLASNGFDVTSFISNMEETIRPTSTTHGNIPSSSSYFNPVPLTNLAVVFQKIRSLGLKVAILSADDRENVEMFLKSQDLEVDALVCGNDRRGFKPNAEPLEAVASDLDADVATMVMVGDSRHDVDCALNAGAWSVGVLSGVGDSDNLGAADFVLQSVADLPLLFTVRRDVLRDL